VAAAVEEEGLDADAWRRLLTPAGARDETVCITSPWSLAVVECSRVSSSALARSSRALAPPTAAWPEEGEKPVLLFPRDRECSSPRRCRPFRLESVVALEAVAGVELALARSVPP